LLPPRSDRGVQARTVRASRPGRRRSRRPGPLVPFPPCAVWTAPGRIRAWRRSDRGAVAMSSCRQWRAPGPPPPPLPTFPSSGAGVCRGPDREHGFPGETGLPPSGPAIMRTPQPPPRIGIPCHGRADIAAIRRRRHDISGVILNAVVYS